MSQNFDTEWKEVEALMQKQLPKSAYEKANTIFEKSISSNHQEQIVKSVFYLQSLSSQLEETEYDNRGQKEIKYIEKNLSKVSGGAKSILLSFLGEKYGQYLDQHYYQIQSRTKSEGGDQEDLALWTARDLANRSQALYLQSCEDPFNKEVPISQFKSLISNTESRYVKNLYDFLHRRAIQALSNERSYLPEPEYKFILKKEQLVDLEKFVQLPLDKTDTNSHKYLVLSLYQKLIKEHLVDQDPTILIDLELQRLEFMMNNYQDENRNAVYRKLLINLFERYKSNDEAYYALLELAELCNEESQKYGQTHDSTLQWKLKEVVKIYEQIISNCKDENIVSEAKNRRNSILQNITLNIESEKVYLPNKPILAKLSYTNLDKIYYRIYSKGIALDEVPKYIQPKEYFEQLMDHKAVKSGFYSLKNVGDYLGHSTEIDLPALEKGNYIVVISKNENFSTNNNYLQAITFSVSSLAYFFQQDPTKKFSKLIVVDRENGNPLPNVEVKTYQKLWERVQTVKLIDSKKSNEDGIVEVPTTDQQVHYFFVLKTDNDVLHELQDHYFYYDGYQNQDNLREEYQLFLDREIYRPGQTIYFKGIAYQLGTKSTPKVLANKNVEVYFQDVNGQSIETKNFKTNDYGTFNGFMIAPKSGLLGTMNLVVNGAYYKSVKVEEYKRPTFEVVFDTFSQTAKLGDSIQITGKGLAYSGANLPNAKLKYRILRQTRYPYWRCWWISYQEPDKQLAHGETVTDENGKFSFRFKAEKGEDNPWDNFPIYHYQVAVDMTDVTGETQLGSTSIALGKVDFQIIAQPKEVYKANEKFDIPVSFQNLQGNAIERSYEVKIEKLVVPTILFQKRYWDRPDFPTMTEVEFKKKFPFTAYSTEDRIEDYKIEKRVSSENKNLSLNAGAYKMSISAKDNEGKELKIEKYFTVVGQTLGNEQTRGLEQTMGHDPLSSSNPVVVSNLKSEYEPGQSLDLKLVSSQKNQKIWYNLIKREAENSGKWGNQSTTSVETMITEKDRGGMHLQWTTVWNNRIYIGDEIIHIPWTNKQLDIEYITFRDKLAPGQQEEWQIKIKGKKGDKVMAEVLATMYDQSLDVFAPNSYQFFPYSNINNLIQIYSHSFANHGAINVLSNLNRERYLQFQPKIYPNLIYFQGHFGGYGGGRRGGVRAMKGEMMNDGVVATMAMAAAPEMAESKSMKTDQGNIYFVDGIKVTGNAKTPSIEKTESTSKTKPIKIRTNLNETVFFMPDLKTDADGNVIIKFTMNEALTKWKFLTLATTKELQIGIGEKSIVTQKDLMIQPNAPRFLRENDMVYFTAKVTNLSDKKLNGTALLELNDAVTFKSVNEKFGASSTQQFYEIEAGQTKAIEWKLNVPENISALTYRLIAKAGSFSDGEENTIPILSNKMLVTETMPFNLKANSKKSFEFKEMTEKMNSTTLRSKVFKLEYTSNPMWYAIQSLPYLMEYPYECSEQIFNRYFANALSSHIVNQYPKIKTVFESWKGSEAMLSNLSKNQSLKSALLEETPWVLAACSEEEQRKNIAVLFDLNRLAQEEQQAIDKLVERQLADGSFGWFPGGYSNPYITQYILEGMGHLVALGVKNYESNEKAKQIIDRGISFLDLNIVRHYREMEANVKRYGGSLSDDHLDPFAMHYLYTRSFFTHAIPKETQFVINYYHKQGLKYWTKKSLYEEGMLALYYHRLKEIPVTKDMMKSFRERAKINEEKGMYWDMDYGYWWYQLPIETHSLMTEVFENLSDKQEEKDNLKIWLLKNKQTNRWETTKGTASAIYALLGGKSSSLEIPKIPTIAVGENPLVIDPKGVEQGTGYIQKTWVNEDIKPSFSKIEVENPNPNIAWGAVYWQYNEVLNKIKSNKSTPLKMEKKLFIVRNTNQGETMEEVVSTALDTERSRSTNEQGNIKIGDKLRIRLTLFVEREMEFLHLKDMRAAGTEPKDAISGYKWSGGLGYYQTTRDASMNFFIDHINKGTYTIEYDLLTNLKGIYSNGITTFQSMYAPEFNSHSEGMEVRIK